MKNFILNKLATVMNRYLNLDPHSHERLQKLKDRVVTVEFMPLHFIFQIIFTHKGVELKEGGDLPAETIVRGTPLQMLHMIVSKQDRQKFFAEDLEIEGNADLGQQVIQLFDELEIDWEEQLAKLTGDIPSHHINQFARKIKNWINNTSDSIREDISDFIHEESVILPSKESLKHFYHDIDILRMDVDRLEAKVKHLQALIDEAEETLL